MVISSVAQPAGSDTRAVFVTGSGTGASPWVLFPAGCIDTVTSYKNWWMSVCDPSMPLAESASGWRSCPWRPPVFIFGRPGVYPASIWCATTWIRNGQSPQANGPAHQGVPRMPTTICLAQKVGNGMGPSEILLPAVPPGGASEKVSQTHHLGR